jgi:hypothetical protein
LPEWDDAQTALETELTGGLRSILTALAGELIVRLAHWPALEPEDVLKPVQLAIPAKHTALIVDRVWTSDGCLWIDPLMGVAYAYELRRDDEVLSTGRLTTEGEVGTGDELALAGILARVEELGWVNGEARLTLRPTPL